MTRLEALLAYQQTELEKERAEAAVRSTPARVRLSKLHRLLKTQQATIARLNEELEARAAQAKRLGERADQLEKQLSLESGEFDTIRQDEESTAEEMTELRGDIEKLSREMAAAAEEYQTTRQTAGKAKKEYDQLRAVCEQERADSAEELAAFDLKLSRIERDIDPTTMQRYRRARQHHSAPVVKVENGKCSGCNMSLPMALLKRLSAPGTLLECENCGRLLYAQQQ